MMRISLIGSWAALFACAGLAAAQDVKLLPPAPPVAQPKANGTLADPPVLPRAAFGAPVDTSATGTQFWFNADYLLWWNKSAPSPPLAAVGNVPAQAGPFIEGPTKVPTSPGFIGLVLVSGNAGTLNATNANTVFGGDLAAPVHSGTRLSFGGWLDSTQTLGIEGTYLLVIGSSARFNASSPGTPGLSVPYRDANTGTETSYPVAQLPTTVLSQLFINTTPDVFVGIFKQINQAQAEGHLAVRDLNSLQGGELNAYWNPTEGGPWRVLGIVGLRYLQMDERLTIDADTTNLTVQNRVFPQALGLPNGAIPVMTNTLSAISKSDLFRTNNNFYGGQFGFKGEYQRGPWSLLLGAKVAFGDMHEIAQVEGYTTALVRSTQVPTKDLFLAGIPVTTANGAPPNTTITASRTAGGIFAQPSNGGHFHRDIFTVVPEGNLRVAYRVSDRTTVSVGYTFLYMSNVARPAGLIDRNIGPEVLTVPPGTPFTGRPGFVFNGSDYWVQGIDLGLQFRF
jgi:hypothetical protein